MKFYQEKSDASDCTCLTYSYIGLLATDIRCRFLQFLDQPMSSSYHVVGSQLQQDSCSTYVHDYQCSKNRSMYLRLVDVSIGLP